MLAEDEKNLTEPLKTDGPWRPDGAFDSPEYLSRTLTRRVLPLVTSPARYIGGELGARRDGFDPAKANLLLAFPDAYEVGMSHQGLRILYSLLMARDDTFCDLAYTPWPDMEARMRAEGMPLFGLESRRPVGQFDVVGFSLGYELAYANMLTMIDMAGVSIWADQRGPDDPIFVAGGSCTLNPAVVGPFLDVVLLGDGEDAILDVAALTAQAKRDGKSRADLVADLRALPGAWHPGVTEPVRARVVQDLNTYPPPAQLVPIIEPVHDRLALEVMRGCVRGCRFCQAGMITRPVRERDPDKLVEAAREGIKESGYAEVSLLSLSTSDYSGLSGTVAGIQDELQGSRTNLVLPSLRVDSVDPDLYDRISRERPANFTFAPEAGNMRLRDVINKQISDDEIVTTARQALASGVKGVKLYFMIGLPTETNADLDDLVALVGRVVGAAPKGGSQIHVSISPFAPKAHTPFQWAGQISRDEMRRRNTYLGGRLNRLRVKVSLRDPEISCLEGVLGLGDARVAEAVAEAWRQGARFDGWSEFFDFARWEQAFTTVGLDTADYLDPRDPEAPLPWDLVHGGVDKAFLQRDWRRAQRTLTLADCRLDGDCYKCDACDGDIQHIHAQMQDIKAPAVARVQAVPGFDPRNADPAQPGKEARKWTIWRQQAANKCWHRVEYTKTGDMVFLGHLDFQRQLQLALRRSGLPVAYSRGYHPHPLVKFGPPLPVGVAGLQECLDIAFECQVPSLVEALNSTLPDGLRILGAAVAGAQAPSSIDQIVERSEYLINLPAPDLGGPGRDAVTAAVDAFMGSSEWLCVRKRPKGDLEMNARELVPTGGLGLEAEPGDDGGVVLRLCLAKSKTGASLPVHDFLATLLGEALPQPGHSLIQRLGYYGRHSDGRWISPLEEVGETSRRFWLGRHMIG